jgi:hypothetical protein
VGEIILVVVAVVDLDAMGAEEVLMIAAVDLMIAAVVLMIAVEVDHVVVASDPMTVILAVDRAADHVVIMIVAVTTVSDRAAVIIDQGQVRHRVVVVVVFDQEVHKAHADFKLTNNKTPSEKFILIEQNTFTGIH